MSELVKGIMSDVTPAMVQGIAGNLGESEMGITKALNGMLPTLLAAMIGKSSNDSAFNNLFDLVTDPKSRSLLDNLGNSISSGSFMRTAGNNDLVGTFLKRLFGDRSSDILSAFSGQNGLRTRSTGPMMNISAQLVVGHLSRSIKRNGLEAGSFIRFLSDEKSGIIDALPPGMIGLLGLDGNLDPTDAPVRSNKTALIIGLIAMGMVAIWIWDRYDEPPVETVQIESPVLKFDTTDTATTNAFKAVQKNVPGWYLKLDNGYELIGDSAGIERNLFQFISSNKVVDTTTWFNCDHIVFQEESTALDMDQSMDQLNNIAAIMKAFPNVELKIGGYTDSKGSSAENQKISQERADAVRNALLKLGIRSTRIGSEGYGDQYPVAGNNTEEGRSQNRRVAIRVTAK
ncbi:MAG: OmpA family protein [Flavobacteriales bacterium]